MTGLLVIAGALAFITVLVLVLRLVDRARGIDSSDKWAGWYRSKSTLPTPPFGPTIFGAQGYDSMDDHGNRDQDAGLR
jgi:hypothetical protein